MHKGHPFLLSYLLLMPAMASQPVQPTLPQGTDLPAAVERQYSITVYPDGRNLPPGRGTPEQGRILFANQCAFCHGKTGIEGPAARLVGSDGFWSWREPLRPLRVLKYPLLINSVGAQWPYATTIFDYIRRAMPHHAPKSLKADEVYALTAYILLANDLIEPGTPMTALSLPSVVMPGKARGAPPHLERNQAPTPQ